MGWSTSVVSPPDGDMGDYIASLEKLLARDETTYWPTHGAPITDPKRHVAAFIAHRQERAEAVWPVSTPATKPWRRWCRKFTRGWTNGCFRRPPARPSRP